ncbi:peptidylprolyl isomerase [Accumulibacter sp.]|uniref:peptidylprolyl isomerase n=1 Tax=Accumulibacter sp. TaxID=2053492 RepID=UPI0025F53C3D|nr:peptidylprolyl isomerase [Accumulibacter sp.]MCM8613055.1 peptidylprolyl isomerase [Accumulibacter sp.]MCM8636745.1 peptidylprolyl isomerase [Accumulibacter sp.]MCM8640396.1 peptidylprolyl isomerase [Accumulibacter sp.]
MITLLLRGALVSSCLVGAAVAQQRPGSQPVPVDRVIAVVNDEVITRHDLRARLDSALAQLKRQGMQPPPRDVLERQVLERLVVDRVQLQLARDMGLRVDDAQLEQALQRIASGNRMTLGQFRAALEKDGIVFASFREEIRAEMTIARVREREVDSKIFISDGEIDNYLSGVSTPGGAGEEYRLAHILLRAPESASPEQIQKLRAKAEQVLDRLRKGDDFGQLAASYSDAPDGMKGGDLGWRPIDRLPAIFAEASGRLKVGEVSPILRSSNGFHLVKLLDKRGGGAVAAVEQTHARHILIKVNEIVSEPEARHKIEGLRQRISHGERFAELARLFSQDGSASKGGDLGWIYPGDTVPEFERAMNQLAPGELSQPVQSPFGYHLIEVLERRVQDVSSERQRVAARQTLRERKRDEAYQDWLRQARDRAYVEIRLEEG